MRTIIAVATAGTAFLLGVGTVGTMAQTSSGSPSQSAPVGLDSNPATTANRPAATVTMKNKTHAHHPTAHTTGKSSSSQSVPIGSPSQSAPVGEDSNPAAGSR